MPVALKAIKATLAATSPFATENDALRVSDLRQRIADAAPELWTSAAALVQEVESLRALLRDAKGFLDKLPWDCRPWTAIELREKIASALRADEENP